MEIKKIKEVYKGFLKISNLKVKTKKGVLINREVMSRSSNKSDIAVASLVYSKKEDKFIFVKQFRPGLFKEDNPFLVEVVAGVLENGEDDKECIIREVEEEIGYRSDLVQYLGEGFASPGGTSEKVYLYYIEVGEKISEGGGVDSENEEIEVVKMTKDELINYNFKDLKTISIIGIYNTLIK